MAIAVANSWKVTTSGADPLSLSVTGFGAGELVVALAFGFENTGGPETFNFADSAGNSYTKVAESVQDGTTYRSWSAIAWAIAASAPTSVTADRAAGGAVDGSMCVLRVTGNHATPHDQSNSKQQTADDPTSASITTTNADDLIVVGLCHDEADRTFDAPASFTIAQENESNSIQAFAVAYRVVSSTGTYAPQWTTNGSSDYGMVTASFKAAAAAAASGVPFNARRSRRNPLLSR